MKLKEYLKKNRYTAVHFAKLIGISRTGLDRFLHGREPSLRTAIKIVEFTNAEVTFTDLLSDEKDKKKVKKPPESKSVKLKAIFHPHL